MATLAAGETWFPLLRGSYVSYLRRSDRTHTRLRLDKQREAIRRIVSPGRAHELEEFIEVEGTGSRYRPELMKAIALCEERKAALIIGHLGTMRYREAILTNLADRRVKFRCADKPDLPYFYYANRRHMEKQKRLEAGRAIKASLAIAKKNGKALGGERGNTEVLKLGPAASAAARQRRALESAKRTMVYIRSAQTAGVRSLTDLALYLNERGQTAPRGGKWTATQVQRIFEKFDREPSE